MDTYKCQSGVMRRCGVYLADNCDGTYKGDDCECAADNQAFMPPTERDELQAYRALGTVDELSALVKARDEGRVVTLPCKPGEHWKDCSGQEVVVVGFHWDQWSGWSVTFRFVNEAENGDDLSAVNFIYWAHNMTRAEAGAALGGGGDG